MSQGWSERDGDLSMLAETDLNRSVDSGFVDITMGSPKSIPTLGTRRNRMSTHDRINSALQILRDGRISILDFLVTILDPADASYATYRDRLYVPSVKEKNSGTGRLEKVLDFLWEDPRSHGRVLEWMRPHAISSICNTVYREMDNIKRSFHATLESVTPELLLSFDVETTIASVAREKAPVLYQIIASAAQTERAKANNKVKDCSIV